MAASIKLRGQKIALADPQTPQHTLLPGQRGFKIVLEISLGFLETFNVSED